MLCSGTRRKSMQGEDAVVPCFCYKASQKEGIRLEGDMEVPGKGMQQQHLCNADCASPAHVRRVGPLTWALNRPEAAAIGTPRKSLELLSERSFECFLVPSCDNSPQ